MLTSVESSIQKLSISFPQGDVNVYLVKGSSGYTVIDTGVYSEQAVLLWEQLIADGLAIEKVVLTHTHPDHIGMAGWLKKKLGVPIAMPAIGFARINKQLRQWELHKEHEDEPYDFLLKHGGAVISYKQLFKQAAEYDVVPDELIEDGQEISIGDEKYEAIWTPGHAPDHFCYYDSKNRYLIAGDHVIADFSPVITFTSEEDGNPLQQYFQSLDRVAELPAELVLPGHGGVTRHLLKRVEELKDGHHQRMFQIMDVLGANEMTAGAISRAIYAHSDPAYSYSLEIQSSLARLTYLLAQGEVSSREVNGQVLFAALQD